MINPALINITLEEDSNGALADEVERKLLDALRQNVPPSDGKPLTLIARDLQGGMTGLAQFDILWLASCEDGLGGRGAARPRDLEQGS